MWGRFYFGLFYHVGTHLIKKRTRGTVLLALFEPEGQTLPIVTNWGRFYFGLFYQLGTDLIKETGAIY